MPTPLSSRLASPQFNLGCILVGSYINSMLYAVAMLCVYFYYRSDRSKRDPLFVKAAVASCAAMDTVATFGVCGSYFYLSVLRWGAFDYNFRTHWLPIMTFIASAFTEIIVQGFMVRRYFIMSKQYFICAFIIVLMVLSLEANLFLAISSAVGSLPAIDRWSNLTPFMYAHHLSRPELSLSSTLASDLCTTISMYWTLRKTNTYTNISRHLVSRISVIIVVTGTVTCVVVTASMVTFLAYPMSALTTTFTCFVGRVYSLSMLFTLLYRDAVNSDRWTQVDAFGETISTVHYNIDENIRGSSAPVLDLTFAHRTSFSHTRGQKDMNIQQQEKLDSVSTIEAPRDDES